MYVREGRERSGERGGRASHGRKSIYRRCREPRKTRGNGTFVRESSVVSILLANMVIVAPGVRVTHLTTIVPSH